MASVASEIIHPSTNAFVITAGFPFRYAMPKQSGDSFVVSWHYDVVDGVVPPGLQVDPDTGDISGMPTTHGEFQFSVRLMDTISGSKWPAFDFSFSVSPVLKSNLVVLSATRGQDFTGSRPLITGGLPPFTFSASDLPPGLTVNSVTGALAGIPTASGVFTVNVMVEDSNGAHIALDPYAVEVVTPVDAIGDLSLREANINVNFQATVVVQRFLERPSVPVVNCVLGAGSVLPLGVLLNSEECILSGIPQQSGVFPFVLVLLERATGAHGTLNYGQPFVLTVNGYACGPGTTNHDNNNNTECLTCPAGTAVPITGVGACEPCPAGAVDDDSDSATPCEPCGPGHYVLPGQAGSCANFLCPAGTVDLMGNGSSPCSVCAAGVFAPAGSSGPCSGLKCPAGTVDADNNPQTPCFSCPPGSFTEAGSVGVCRLCEAGSIDEDSDARTACVPCTNVGNRYIPPGSFGSCLDARYICAAGFVAGSATGSTPCVHSESSSSSSNGLTAGGVAAVVMSLVFVVVLIAIVSIVVRRTIKGRRPFEFASPEMTQFLSDQGLTLAATDDEQKNLHAPVIPRELARKHIRLLEEIGQGEFATVRKGLLNEKTTTGIPEFTVAVKVLVGEQSEARINEFMCEAAMVAQFQHPNVIALVGVCTAGAPAMLVMQYCEHGSLRSFLRRHVDFNELRLRSKVRILLDVAEGMAYLSSQNVVHRDLSARNVLVGGDFVCKVSDFGLSRKVELFGADYVATGRGLVPLRWTAPEALVMRQFSTASDVWSFAVLCGEVFDNGALPYSAMGNEDVFRHVQSGGILPCSPSCPNDIYVNVIQPCMAQNPADRFTFSELCTVLLSLLGHERLDPWATSPAGGIALVESPSGGASINGNAPASPRWIDFSTAVMTPAAVANKRSATTPNFSSSEDRFSQSNLRLHRPSSHSTDSEAILAATADRSGGFYSVFGPLSATSTARPILTAAQPALPTAQPILPALQQASVLHNAPSAIPLKAGEDTAVSFV